MPAIGITFVTGISCAAMDGSLSSEDHGGAITATMITVAGSGCPHDGDRAASGSAVTITKIKPPLWRRLFLQRIQQAPKSDCWLLGFTEELYRRLHGGANQSRPSNAFDSA